MVADTDTPGDVKVNPPVITPGLPKETCPA